MSNTICVCYVSTMNYTAVRLYVEKVINAAHRDNNRCQARTILNIDVFTINSEVSTVELANYVYVFKRDKMYVTGTTTLCT